MAECEDFVGRLLGVRAGRPRLAQLAAQQVNAPGDALARRLGVCGPVVTVSSACASGGLALGLAFEALLAGEVEVALAGGADALCQLTYAGFNALRSVDPGPCRPFRADREGLNLGEGAGVLILETLEHARARDATILAELAGCGASCDAHHMTAPDPEGGGAAAAIRAALAAAGLEPAAVSFVNAHGTGTPHNDAAEARALGTVFGERSRSLPVTSSKGSIGHLLGSSGAVEAVATVLALLDGAVQPTPGAEPADSELGVDLVVGEPRPIPPDSVGVSTSFAFGGANAAVVLAAAVRLSEGP
jgi:3-oxoacyl-[acyl-carrier-protein] synthase II